MKKLRVLVLVHADHVPPESTEGYTDEQIDAWKAEFDVTLTLRNLGHEVLPVGIYDDLAPLRDALRDFQPDITFMMLEEFYGVVTYDFAVTSYLELMRQPYTGCNPRGLLLSKDKSLTKKLLAYHRIPTPHFTVFAPGRKIRRPKRLRFPLFVKSSIDDASLGISQASIVHDDEALVQRVQFLQERTTADVLAEEYIDGREFYVGVIGNERLQTFPVWELLFSKMPPAMARIATRRVKWDRKYQVRHGIETEAARDLEPALDERIRRICKRVYRA